MKKKSWLLGTVMAGILAMAGCGSEAPDAAKEIDQDAVAGYVQAAGEMLEEADSFAAEFSAVAAMGEKNKTTTTGTVMMVKEPLYMKTAVRMTFDDGEKESFSDEIIYLENRDGVVSQYMNYDGQWTEMTLAEDIALTGVQIYHTLYNMETIFTAAENWAAEKEDGKIVLKGVIPEEKFYDVEEYTRWFQLAGMSGLSEVYYAGVGNVPVTVTLDEKTGAPLSYSVDLAEVLETVTNNVLTELGGGTLSDGVDVVQYTISSELTQLGGVKAEEIPAEAKNDAINYEKEISMLEEE